MTEYTEINGRKYRKCMKCRRTGNVEGKEVYKDRKYRMTVDLTMFSKQPTWDPLNQKVREVGEQTSDQLLSSLHTPSHILN